MEIFNASISKHAMEEILRCCQSTLLCCNHELQKRTGIVDFFEHQADFDAFKTIVANPFECVSESDRSEYGDFQTNMQLAKNICILLKAKQIEPKMIIEPTCGKGAFIIAALQTFPKVAQIIGIEIFKPYLWQTKFSIVEHFLNQQTDSKPTIILHHKNIFDFNFDNLRLTEDVLVLGNPPWVTNTMLSTLESKNLPAKSNFKQHTGLDALTGKGNFDIGEFILLMLIKTFQHQKGNIAFLVKNSVIKNIVHDQKRNQYQLSHLEKQKIDAQKEFQVAVDAALFYAQLGAKKDYLCQEIDFYTQKKTISFGWSADKFVSNLETYAVSAVADGICPFEWRQGVKHDCSKVMELERPNDFFSNGKGESFELEKDLIYGILKSSDLKQSVICNTRKYTIITQKKIGQETLSIATRFPKTWQYLMRHKPDFDNRKSIIYKGKPPFSIFGIGDYSFAPYKVAISGFYKTTHFSLVLPQKERPILLDDTCYFIGFDNLEHALITQALLNSKRVQAFLESIIFWDSKRAITKDILSRIDLRIIVQHVDFESIAASDKSIPYSSWESYQQLFKISNQLTLGV
ncbi:MAG: hypothetical protein RL329_1717 [Bacteroidota bacterium]